MITQYTRLDVADNTGAKRLQCIQVLKGSAARQGKHRLRERRRRRHRDLLGEAGHAGVGHQEGRQGAVRGGADEVPDAAQGRQLRPLRQQRRR